MKTTYNKLVRDKIPEIIEESGKKYDISYATSNELSTLLEAKLDEEVNEYKEAKNLEELADILEVVFALADNLGYSEEDLFKLQSDKKEKRGGFKKGIILNKVYE